MSDLVVAIGLVLVIEGVLYAAFPAGMKRAIAQVVDLQDASLRRAGLAAALAGLALVWLIRG